METTYLEVIPQEIIHEIVLMYLDNRSIYNLYLSINGNLDKFLNMMIIKDPFKHKDEMWEIISELLSKTNGIIAGSYVLKNILNETMITDIDVYISEDYIDLVKIYFQKMNDYFDEVAGKRVSGSRRGGMRSIHNIEVLDGKITEKDPEKYYKLKGFDLDLPTEIHEISYTTYVISKAKLFQFNMDINIIKKTYDVLTYLRTITDFRFLRNYMVYSLGKRKLIVDYPDEVFGKIIELNHDRHIKGDRFYKY